jgi:hypothetical protein
MADDARISTALPRHPKTVKLHRRLGAPGCWSLICLFLWVADNRPDGDLKGMTAEDIEIAANWAGDIGTFVVALSEIRFVDGMDGAYKIHQWAEHNPWAAGRPDRIKSAKEAANARWQNKRTVSDPDTQRMRSACESHETAMPTSPHLTTLPDHTTPDPPSAEDQSFHSKEKNYSQTDFDARDRRKLADAFKNIALRLEASVGSGFRPTEKEIFEWACRDAGISVERGLDVEERGKKWPQPQPLGASA